MATALEKLGFESFILPLPSFCSLAESAEQLEDWLRRDESSEPLALISLSKGGADVSYFIESGRASRSDLLHQKLACWISLSGICFGTPIVEETLKNPLRKLLIRLIFSLRGYSFRALLELGSRGLLQGAKLEEKNLPFPCLHVVGFPNYRNLRSPLAKKSVFRLKHLGASDGGGFLWKDCLRLPGTGLPLVETDHYLAYIPEEEILGLALRRLGWGDLERENRAGF